uniref:Small ribosomal subunit protein mS26 n=1 Tax=Arion vulgaris TaxID=1028688 RepID=A0A0B6ZFX9_9EUPU
MSSRIHLPVARSIKEIILLGSSTQRSPIVHIVRFRKPWWVPIAKSKEFYVRKPTPIIPEEYDELKHRYRVYRAEVESIRLFLKIQLSENEVRLAQEQVTHDTAELDDMIKHAQEWNTSISVSRNERQETEKLKEEQHLQLLQQKYAENQVSVTAAAKDALLKHQAVSSDFIQPDKLEEAIEKMLDSRSDYNYAITKSGSILPGEFPDRTAH